MNIEKIKRLNDTFRKSFHGGRVVLTVGIQSIPADDRSELLKQVQEFDNFTEDNDPYGEHDFGCFEYKGQQIFWKIDLYDLNYEFYSPQPDDETQTNRVLTIMFAEEY